MTTSTLIVVPTFNEVENVARLLTAIREALPSANVLIVDDASPDGTADIVRQLARADPRVHLLARSSKLGLGSAYVAGFGWGLERDFAQFFQMDADFSHDPRALPAFVAALNEGADLVVGSRNVPGGMVEGWGIFRHILSKGGSFYSRVILDSAVRDMTSGFKGYTRRALVRVDTTTVRSNGYAFQVETIYRAVRAGLRIVELPIVFVDRRVGQSKMTRHEIAEGVSSVWRMRFDRWRAP